MPPSAEDDQLLQLMLGAVVPEENVAETTLPELRIRVMAALRSATAAQARELEGLREELHAARADEAAMRGVMVLISDGRQRAVHEGTSVPEVDAVKAAETIIALRSRIAELERELGEARKPHRERGKR